MSLLRKAAGPLLALMSLGACATIPATPPDGSSPLIYDPAAVEAAEMIVIAAPGVLTSVSMFDRAEAWADEGVAVMRYRFPGADGLGLDHKVTIEGMASVVDATLARYPGKKVGLLGYSAGGQMVLSIAPGLAERAPRVVVWSSSIGFPQTLKTAISGGFDVAGLAIGRGTTDIDRLWRINYPKLLVGDERDRAPECRDVIDRIYAAEARKIQVPSRDLLDAQAGDLTLRRLTVGSAPTLFLHGERDPTTPKDAAEAKAAEGAETRFETLPGHGHLIHLTAPEVFDRSLAFFLDDSGPPIEWRDPCEETG